MSNPYKESPFGIRLLLIFVVVSAFPLLELYAKSIGLRQRMVTQMRDQEVSEKRLVEFKEKLEKLKRLKATVESLQQKLSIYTDANQTEFKISELIRSAAELSAQKGIVVDYLQAKESSNGIEATAADHQDIDIGLVGQFAPVLQFMQQLLKTQKRISIVDVDVLGNDPLQKFLQMSGDGQLPEAKDLQQISSVRVNATLRIVRKI